ARADSLRRLTHALERLEALEYLQDRLIGEFHGFNGDVDPFVVRQRRRGGSRNRIALFLFGAILSRFFEAGDLGHRTAPARRAAVMSIANAIIGARGVLSSMRDLPPISPSILARPLDSPRFFERAPGLLMSRSYRNRNPA